MTSINQDKLHELFDYVEGIVSDEKVPAAQIAIGHEGELAGMRTFGVAHQGRSVGQAGDDTLFCMFSSTKAIVGIGVWKLLDEGMLDLDERVVDIIPGWCAEGNGEAWAPGLVGTATLPDLDRAFERSFRVAYLPYIDAVLTQLPKQPDRPIRPGHHLPDRGKVLRSPKRTANGAAPPLKRRFTEHRPRGRSGPVVPGQPSGHFVRKAAFNRGGDFTRFVLDRSMQKRVSVDRNGEDVESRRSSVFVYASDPYYCGGVGLERRQVFAESERGPVPKGVFDIHPPAPVVLVFQGVVRPMDGGDRVEDLSESRETA